MADKRIEMINQISKKEGILTTELDEEVGMFNIETGKYYTLDHVSSDIWNMIDKPILVNEIVDKLMERYEIDTITCSQHTLEFLTKLQEMKLLHIQ